MCTVTYVLHTLEKILHDVELKLENRKADRINCNKIVKLQPLKVGKLSNVLFSLRIITKIYLLFSSKIYKLF